MNPGLAVYGGTFDPVHFGHLRSALEVRQALQVSELKLMPSFSPPHRGKPGASAHDRLAMLNLATSHKQGLKVDEREIRREGLSYTVDTLGSIRGEVGSERPLSLILGADAYGLLHTWRGWRRLSELAHLVILQRPDVSQVPAEEVVAWHKDRLVADPGCLGTRAAGLVCCLRLTQIDISATKIRGLIEKGEPVDYLLPAAVVDYIHQHQLYEQV